MPYNQPYKDPNDARYSQGGYTWMNGEWVRNNDLPGMPIPQTPSDKATNTPGGIQGSDGRANNIARDTDRFGKDFEHEFTSAPGSVHQNIRGEIGKGWDSINGARQPANVRIAGQQRSMGPDGTNEGQTRGMQMQLLQQLQSQAAGNGPSLAQMQLQKGTDQNISNAMALGASQRGAGQAGMLKGIQGQQAGIAQGMANDAGMLRLQEQMQAQGMLGQQLGATRGADQSWAGMGMQNSQFNAGQGNQMSMSQANIDVELEKLRADAAKQASPMGAIGGLMGGMSMSDENLKTDVQPGDDALFAFLDSIDAHDYEYKDEKHGKGRRISPMAQELEKSELGQQFVFEAEDGKAVDYGKGLGTMLASQAALHKRLKKIEEK